MESPGDACFYDLLFIFMCILALSFHILLHYIHRGRRIETACNEDQFTDNEK